MLKFAFKQTRALLLGRPQLTFRRLFSEQIESTKPEDEELPDPTEDVDVSDLEEDPENDDVSTNPLEPEIPNPSRPPAYQTVIQNHFAKSSFWQSQAHSLITQDKLPIQGSLPHIENYDRHSITHEINLMNHVLLKKEFEFWYNRSEWLQSYQKISNFRSMMSTEKDTKSLKYLFNNLVNIERENKPPVDLIDVLMKSRDGRLSSGQFWSNIKTLDLEGLININSGYIKNMSEISFFKLCEICQKYKDGMDLRSFNGLLVILLEISKVFRD
jgi:hypothetical protein